MSRIWRWLKSGEYNAGTLKYSRLGLFTLLFWLLWGDLVWTIFDQSIPSILPYKLKDMGAGDMVNQVLNRSLSYAVVFVLCPIIGFYSDRHRGRRGRRIPFIMWSTPFVALFLVLIGCHEGLTNLFMGSATSASVLGMEFGRTTVAIVVIGALFICYDIANIFINTVYWYLFNDVVPEQYLSRFLAVFGMVGLIGSAIYNKFIFPHALDHFRFIFVAGGIGYLAGMMIVCFMVREGQYPPPPERKEDRTGLRLIIRTYFRECFTHKLYWYFFTMNMFMSLSWQTGIFVALRNRYSLHLDMQQLGNIGFWTNIASLIILLPAGWLSDKLNPVRMYVFTCIIMFFEPVLQCIWIFTDFGPTWNMYGVMLLSILFLPVGAANGTAEIPMYMRLLPKALYGQFCSANALFRAFALIFGSILAGLFMKVLQVNFGMDDWRYRYYPLWVVAFQIPALIMAWLMFKEWRALGGVKDYTPPQATLT